MTQGSADVVIPRRVIIATPTAALHPRFAKSDSLELNASRLKLFQLRRESLARGIQINSDAIGD